VLKALARWILRKDAVSAPEGPKSRFITPEDLHSELQKLEKRVEWEMDEWYDKFSALHARAEKRHQRENKKNGNGTGHDTAVIGEQPRRVSVLANRKPWSP